MFDKTAVYILEALTIVTIVFIPLGIPLLDKLLSKK